MVSIKNSDVSIEIVRSNVPYASSLSKVSANEIFKVLREHYTSVLLSDIDSPADLEAVIARSPDLVFLGAKYILAADSVSKIWLSDCLERHGILVTGSSSAAHKYDNDKSSAKRQVSSHGIATAPHYVVTTGNGLSREFSVPYPAFVKPLNLGGGEGVDSTSLVRDIYELKDKISTLEVQYGGSSIVEEYLPGREFTVAVFCNPSTLEPYAMPLEITAPTNEKGDRFLSARVKKADTEIVELVSDEFLTEALSGLALDVFKTLGARDYGRIDIRMDKAGVPNFMEANFLPSLLPDFGNFIKACGLHKSMSHEKIILSIVSLALERTKN